MQRSTYVWMTFSSVPIGETFEPIGTLEGASGLFVKVSEHHARPTGRTTSKPMHVSSPKHVYVRVSADH